MLKILILQSNPLIHLMGMMTELDEEPSILIEGCYSITKEGALEQYPLHTDQRDLFLTSDNVFTIIDPSPEIAEKYRAIA